MLRVETWDRAVRTRHRQTSKSRLRGNRIAGGHGVDRGERIGNGAWTGLSIWMIVALVAVWAVIGGSVQAGALRRLVIVTAVAIRARPVLSWPHLRRVAIVTALGPNRTSGPVELAEVVCTSIRAAQVVAGVMSEVAIAGLWRSHLISLCCHPQAPLLARDAARVLTQTQADALIAE